MTSRAALATVALATVALVAACTPAGGAGPTSTAATQAAFGALGADGCEPASPVQGDQVEGTTDGGTSAYGLLFSSTPEALPADGSTIKMVVRLTGDGEDLDARVVAPDGSDAALVWGPERHGGSTFDRPGDEWGVGFAFDRPGCWRISFDRGGDTADFWFDAV